MSKTFLVSGAGSGIGQAIALKLAQAGNAIVLLGRTEYNLKQTLEQLPEPANHKLVVADLRDKQSLHSALATSKIMQLDGVIANAGVGGENHYGEHDRWHEIIETNLTGTYQLVSETRSFLKSNDETFCHIVIISSVLARLGVPGYTAYCASKAGLLGLMRSWASELAGDKVLVNALCPGWVATDMAKQGLQTFAETSGKSYTEVYEEQMSYVPLGKMSTPDEIAEFVNFLVAGTQTSITGQVLDINNGALMPS